ncbi:MAG TPA: 2-C-methyl-D-erythritol 4-phosphate cytidylyltransferase, partial [Thermodesulfobacteriota bacterium]|nr:2-C-methyl-D-erythritol 4-phosphate cytidylyltransferase [Thermodesulfobacteriota bacterium]
MPLKTSAIIAAAGLGRRFGGSTKKQFQSLGGKPILAYSIGSLEESSVREIILVVPEDSLSYFSEEVVNRFNFKKVIKVIPGGEERQHSVKRGFNSLSCDTDIVVVHDGVRPFVGVDLIEEVIKEALKSGGAIAALPVKDTVKKSSYENYIEQTISRDCLWLAQTPQAFSYGILKRAYEEAERDGFLGTDESSLVERLGVQVRLVKGSPMNVKIT